VGENGQGNKLNQLTNPLAICIDDDQTIYIADWRNDRIVEWKSNAHNQVSCVALGVDGQGNLYVVDYWNHRIQKIEISLIE
jgi:sugar lactone lactonase YvrE